MKCEDNWNAKKGMNVITLPVLVIGVYPGNRDSVHVPRDSGPTLLEAAGLAYKPLHSPVLYDHSHWQAAALFLSSLRKKCTLWR